MRLRFLPVFLVTACAGVVANALPYLRTRQAYQSDGVELAGAPFTFHAIGGDCWPALCENYSFHAGHFAADVAIVLACATLAGLLAQRLTRAAP